MTTWPKKNCAPSFEGTRPGWVAFVLKTSRASLQGLSLRWRLPPMPPWASHAEHARAGIALPSRAPPGSPCGTSNREASWRSFGLPTLVDSAEAALDIGDDDLAGAAFHRLIATFGLPDDEVDQGIARALAELCDNLGIGERHEELLIESSRRTRPARLDRSARARMRRLADAMPPQPDVLVGVLREADFDRSTARLRASSGESVSVASPPELADDVQQALRSQAQFEGLVTYDVTTAVARRVGLRHISAPAPLPFDADEFWTTLSVQEHADVQGVAPAALDRAPFSASHEELQDLTEALADLDA